MSQWNFCWDIALHKPFRASFPHRLCLLAWPSCAWYSPMPLGSGVRASSHFILLCLISRFSLSSVTIIKNTSTSENDTKNKFEKELLLYLQFSCLFAFGFFSFLSKCSWFTMLCYIRVCVCVCVCVHTLFLDSFPISVITEYWVEFPVLYGFPDAVVVKNPPASEEDAGDTGSIPGLEGSPGGRNGTSLQYSCLGNRVGRGAWWATVHGVTKSWMNWTPTGPTSYCTSGPYLLSILCLELCLCQSQSPNLSLPPFSPWKP